MLERSKRSDLVIELDCLDIGGFRLQSSWASLRRLKQVIAEHPDRIREIKLLGAFVSELKYLLEVIPDFSLRLTSLVLSAPIGQNYAVPINILADIHCLKHLHIIRIHFPWYSQPLRALTYLAVSFPPQPPPMDLFCAALRAMPTLEVLDLHRSLPTTYKASIIEPISLRNLQRLCLTSIDGLQSLSNVLSIIVVPLETIVSLIYKGPVHEKNHLTQFSSSLAQFFSAMGFEESKKQSYRRLAINKDLSLSFFCDDWTHTANFKLEFPPFLETVVPSVPLQDLSSLSLSCRIPAQTFITCFGNWQHLEHITFCEDGIVGWNEAVRTINSMGLETLAEAVAFPSLRSISMSGATSGDEKGIDFKAFESWLRNRNKRNIGLRKLTLSSCCNINEVKVQSLRGLVDDVDWDGYMGGVIRIPRA